MSIIEELRRVTTQIAEQQRLLAKDNPFRIKSADDLDKYYEVILKDLKQQIAAALEQERLPELKLVIPLEKVSRLLFLENEKKVHGKDRQKILDTIRSLNILKVDMLRSKSNVLKDFDSDFWTVCTDPTTSFNFESEEIIVKSIEKKFVIPYKRFSEPEEVIIAEIAILVQKKEIKRGIDTHEKEIAGLKIKLEELEKLSLN